MQKGRRLFARLEDRFWEKVDRSGGPDACWPWRGATRGGYGAIRVKGQWKQATHIALELAGRPLKEGEKALHSCDWPPCCNARHLWPGSSAANSADMVAKKRSAHGRRNSAVELTEAQVRAIRIAAVSGFSSRQIGRAFGVSQGHARSIITGRSWRFLL